MTGGKALGDPARGGQVTLTRQHLGKEKLGVIREEAAALRCGAEPARSLPPVAAAQRLDGRAEARPLSVHRPRDGGRARERQEKSDDERGRKAPHGSSVADGPEANNPGSLGEWRYGLNTAKHLFEFSAQVSMK